MLERHTTNRTLLSGAMLLALVLDLYAYIGIQRGVARSATDSDVFNAVGEVQRRDILGVLAGGECSVNKLVEATGAKQPQVSKHLRVLREVGLVTVRVSGQRRLYQLNAEALKPIYDWIGPFERLWQERFDRLEDYLGTLQNEQGKEKDESS